MPSRKDPGYDEPLIPDQGPGCGTVALALWLTIILIGGLVTFFELFF